MKTEYDFSKMNSCKNPYTSRMNNPVHPGVLLKEWMPEGMTVAEAALQLGITPAMLSNILNQTAGVSTEMALRLSKWLGTTPEMWTDMQSSWDLWEASKHQNPRVVEAKA